MIALAKSQPWLDNLKIILNLYTLKHFQCSYEDFLVTSIWNHWSPFFSQSIKKFPIPFLEIFLKSNDKGALDYAKKAKGIKIVTSK